MRKFIIFALLFAASIAKNFYFCEVKINTDAVLSEPKLHLKSKPYSWDNFNFVSFGGYQGPSGDVEGRAAVKGSVDVTTYSFGYELRTGGISAIDRSLPFSLVVGGDLTFNGGAIYPQGNGIPYPGDKEYIHVTGSFTGSDYLIPEITGSGSVDADFVAAQAYFTNVQNAFAAQVENTYITQPWSDYELTCPSPAAETFIVKIDGKVLGGTSINKNGCNPAASFVFNVEGTDDVVISGGTFDHKAEKVVYNILGSGRNIRVKSNLKGSILAPNNNLVENTGVVIGHVIVADASAITQINRLSCAPIPNEPVVTPCVGFEKTCAGLDFTIGSSSLSFKEFNAISFGDFNADTGDIEGRLAAKGSVTFGNGYSVGATLSTVNDQPDLSQDYSLIVGGNLVWGNGELYPHNVANVPTQGRDELAAVVGSANVPAHLAERVSAVGNLDSVFDAAKTCYQSYSDDMATKTDTVSYTMMWNGLFITCNDARATENVISLTGAQFSQFTYTVTDNCNFQGRWIINVIGSDDVDITGASFPAIPGGTVYNVIGARTVNIHDTALAGHLLAPSATLNQANGVIIGKVVVNSVAHSLQINAQNTCPDVVPVVIQLVAKGPVSADGYTVAVYGAKDLRVNDVTTAGKITSIDYATEEVTFDTLLTATLADGSNFGTLTLKSTAGRAVYPNQEVNSASVAGFAIATIIAAALVL